MRRALVLVVLVAGAAAIWLVTRDDAAPFPTPGHVRVHGLAAWPADTVAEATEECARAEEWRHDARQTAMRFAEEVMGYPDPTADDYSGDDAATKGRFLMHTRGIRRFFLGSLLEVRKYGDCWYVVDGEPREGGPPEPGLAFAHVDGGTSIVLGSRAGTPATRMGFGDWDATIAAARGPTVVRVPPIDGSTTGHAIYLDPERGISEGVGIDTLAAIPPPPEGPPDEPRRSPPASGCSAAFYAGRSPQKIIRELREGPLYNHVKDSVGYPSYERKSARPLGGGRWRIEADRAVVDATFRSDGGCWRLASLGPARGPHPLRKLWLSDVGASVEVAWGRHREAYVRIGTFVTGAGGLLTQMREPVTFPWTNGPPEAGEPVPAFVALYDEGHIVSVSYGLYSGPGRS
ncbi:MAG TPA: hypothetical protein VG318_10700 [Actinomycetota bacterium]|nr:hypothetical protein [Actinomycetota bacterium]